MGLLASSRIAEIHYEMGDPATAAESLQQAIDKIKGTKKLDTGYIGLSTQDFISRRNFFQALIALEEKNYEKAKELVDEGLQNDPHAIDCLILRYRMPEVSEEYRERTRKLLKEVAQHLRGEIEKRPDSSTPYNQLAWLLGNTGGTGSTGDEEDFEEALKMANKALELSPENPSLLDTLAHVHFGAGQYEKAVQVQEKAVRLAPRSTLLSEELQRFRDKLREVSQE
jgi:tetratricopeptide (TPR) repeat protein